MLAVVRPRAARTPDRLTCMDTSSTLLMRVRDTGDSASWREFVVIYEPLIVAYARQKGLTGQDALDVAQEVFVRLLKALPAFQLDRSRARFRTWLWQVTYSVIVDGSRNNARQVEAVKKWNKHRLPAEDPDEWRSMYRRRVLQHALGKVEPGVKPDHWACFSQHVLEHRPAAEVAEELKISTNAVYVNASRVLAKVRETCIESMGDLCDDADHLPA
jgi:RNA polymerase sigma-70 factor (ECF subfamily)